MGIQDSTISQTNEKRNPLPPASAIPDIGHIVRIPVPRLGLSNTIRDQVFQPRESNTRGDDEDLAPRTTGYELVRASVSRAGAPKLIRKVRYDEVDLTTDFDNTQLTANEIDRDSTPKLSSKRKGKRKADDIAMDVDIALNEEMDVDAEFDPNEDAEFADEEGETEEAASHMPMYIRGSTSKNASKPKIHHRVKHLFWCFQLLTILIRPLLPSTFLRNSW